MSGNLPSWNGAEGVYSRAYKVLEALARAGHASPPKMRRGKIVSGGAISDEMRDLIAALDKGEEEAVKGLLLLYRDRFPDAFGSCARRSTETGEGDDDMPPGVRLPGWIRASVPSSGFSWADLDPERYPAPVDGRGEG